MTARPKRIGEPARIGCLHVIPGTWFRSWRMYTGCSIEICDGERAIIDPAGDPEELRRVAGRGVGFMLHSHIHGDHILYSEIFEGTPLWVPKAEAGDYGDQDKLAREFGISEEMLGRWRHDIDPHEKNAMYTPVARTFEIGERFQIGDTEMVVHSLRGHTRGCVGLEFPGPRAVYTADVDLSSFGPWYGHRGSDIDLFVQNAVRLSEIDADFFITGHEAGVVTAEEFRKRLPGYLGVVDRREERILENLDRPRTAQELIKRGIIYPPHAVNNEWIVHWERVHIEKHLVRMEAHKRILPLGDGRYQRHQS